MSNTLIYYRVLTEKLYNQLNVDATYSFSYMLNGQSIEIPATIDDTSITFDKNTEFDKDIDTLFIKTSLTIAGTQALFGPDGIAANGSKIGIALECYSSRAKYRTTVIASDNIVNDGSTFSCTFSLEIPAKTVTNELDFSFQMFLAASSASFSEPTVFINNKVGVLLGALDNKKLFLSGAGSIFPIFEEPSNDVKLWTIQYDYEDPAQDMLSETVKIVLNSHHKDYALLDPSDKKYCDRLIYEIIASAVTLLFIDLKEKKLLPDLDDAQFASGSILHFFNYLRNNHDIDLSTVTDFSSSLRAYMAKN